MDAKLSTSRNFKRMFLCILSSLVIVAMMFPAAERVSAQDEPTPFSLHIRAYIDGYSQLVIQGSNVYWHHIGAAAPGRWLFVNEPTYLNGTEWYPEWPEIPDAENRDCNCDSSTFGDLIPALPEDQTFVLNVIQARYHAFVSQQPTAGNDYTLIIDFDDGKPDGADWYEVELLPGEPSPLQGEHWGTEGIAHANTCDAYGWAQYDDLPGEVPVRILADGDEIASGETYEHWFYFNLWGLISNYTDHIIQAQAYDKEWQRWVDLASTPKMLHCVNYDLYILNTRDGTVERLTTLENTGEYNPSWSPDGRKIVHDVADAGSHALYITDIKSHGSSPLPGADGGNDASWSPNGRWIVFDRRWTEDGANLYLLPPSGGTAKKVVSNAVNGAWSPDSQRLVFERDGGLWTANAKGGDERPVTDAGYGPSWSPNGLWIAYDLNGDIYKIRVNKNGAPLGHPIQVTSDPASEGGVTWSQDSKQIAFASDASGDSDIWQVPAGGGAALRLVRTNMYGDYDPAFASAGQYIAYESAKMPAQPYIVAFPEWGYVEAQDWPMGDTVRLMIDDPATEAKPDYEAEQATSPNDWGTWWAQFNFDYDLKIGDRVTETDGYLTRTYTVRNLAVRGASQQADLVTGFADPGAVVYLWAWGRDESYRELVTGQDGTWTADYSNDDFNLETGMCGRAEVRDKIGNRTAVDWCVSSPRIVASESGNWFWAADFFPGLLDISIYGSAGEGAALLWRGQREADRDGFVIVDNS